MMIEGSTENLRLAELFYSEVYEASHNGLLAIVTVQNGVSAFVGGCLFCEHDEGS
ncbi:hypothetical protein [Paenibacillus sp. GCM10012303]|uniref:hypothetical protein n=1 Tax=Paenibacillus sp. GCM10012303 TaxID=3317340 RepID=UPI003614C11B